MRGFFAENGVILKETYAYSIDDRPVWVKNHETDEYERNTGQVI